MDPIADAFGKRREQAQFYLGKAAQVWRANWKIFLGVGAVGGAMLFAGSILLIRHPKTPETVRLPPLPTAPQRPAAPTIAASATTVSSSTAIAKPAPPAPVPAPVKPAPVPVAAKPALVTPKPAAAVPKVPTITPKAEPSAEAAAPQPPAEPPPPKRKPHVDTKAVMFNCSTEIGMLCNEFQEKPWSAVRCLRAHDDVLKPSCAQSLEPVDDGE